MTIFEELRADHEKQRQLLDQLLETTGDEQERRDRFAQLKIQLKYHATAEERYFYAPLIDHDATVEMSRHGIAEHHDLDELVAEVESKAFNSPGWMAAFKKLRDKVLHHLKDEEQGFFQRAGKIFSEQQKQSLGNDYRQAMTEQGL